MTIFETIDPASTLSRFDFWWALDGDWVEAPNERRGGCSGVQRIRTGEGKQAYAKRQVGHTYRSLRHPLGRPTVLRERDALIACNRIGITVPEILYCAATREGQTWKALLVSAALEGYRSLEDWYACPVNRSLSSPVHDAFLKQLGATLARLHRARWQHGCLYPKHIFVRTTEEDAAPSFQFALLDLEKCRRRLSADAAARRDLHQLRRHSSWSTADWQTLIYGYLAAFGRPIKGLMQ